MVNSLIGPYGSDPMISPLHKIYGFIFGILIPGARIVLLFVLSIFIARVKTCFLSILLIFRLHMFDLIHFIALVNSAGVRYFRIFTSNYAPHFVTSLTPLQIDKNDFMISIYIPKPHMRNID